MPQTGQKNQPHLFHQLTPEDYEDRMAHDEEFAKAEKERLESNGHVPGADGDKNRRHEALNAAADAGDPSEVTEAQAIDGADWFMSDEVEEEGWIDFELNVSNAEPRWVRFRVQALQRERIDQIRKQNTAEVRDDASPTGYRRETDELAANTRIAVESLVIPDLTRPEMRKVRGQQYADPADALSARFAHKPGLIEQITGKAIDVSGYNEGDVREVRAGKS